MPDLSAFSASYVEARGRFIDAARAHGARVYEYRDPKQKGPQGEALCLDVAVAGPENAERVLVVASGTHGIEGFAGSAAQTWQVPVRVRYSAGGKEGQARMMLTSASGELPLEGAAGCPDWVQANDSGLGYYLVAYQGDLLSKLLAGGAKQLTTPEQIGLLGDAKLLTSSGDLQIDDLLAVLPEFAHSQERQIVEATVELVEGLREMVPAEEALACGCLHAVVAPEALGDEGLALAKRLAALAPVTQRVSKAALQRLAVHELPEGDDLIRAVYGSADFRAGGFRVVPNAVVRRGSFIAKNVVLMPSFVNIGAYVDESTMVDTWATVGSCAQIGKNVHLSGGVGIGGVLEPVQANPVIIEDNCFVGARSEIVEGVIVEENSVISMGVFIGQSTKIFDRETGEILYGRVPAGSVIVSGTLPSGDRSCALYCAVIVKKVDARTRAKTSLNELLRGD